MKQVLQSLQNGKTSVGNVPAPGVRPGCVLIRTHRSLISAGTERMLVEFGKAGLIGKIRSQPEKARQVLDKLRTDGIAPTLEAVFRKLDEPLPLGYSNVGTVIAVGEGVTDLSAGDRVVSNGPHAEVVCVPRNLTARIPEGVCDEQAAFTVVGSIGLQGIRLLAPTFGERVVVYGLGLIGLLAVQMLRASGCEVLGIDVDTQRLALGERFGARCVNAATGSVTAAARTFSDGRGVDAVLITASSRGDEIIRTSAEICRQRGRVVLVGAVGLNLDRDPFFKKELTFQVSCSYGPGRYDDAYEQKGRDYPFGHVRWTQRRNFEAVLAALAARRLQTDALITHRFPIAGAEQAYAALASDRTALGIVLQYPREAQVERTIELADRTSAAGGCRVALIGAGSFARSTLLPALARTGASLTAIASASGVSAQHAARRFAAATATTDTAAVLSDAQTDAVIIATRHGGHADLVCRALQAGKHVFVEKPLALDVEQLSRVIAAAEAAPDRQLAVGFNRRFSPHTRAVAAALQRRCEPVSLRMCVNAGFIPADHWTQDPAVGGGRIIGEGCHFIDLLRHLAGCDIRTVAAVCPPGRDDQMAIVLGFADGSTGSIDYLPNGSKQYPKETLEAVCEGRIVRIDNFRRTQSWGGRSVRCRTWRQDKGHRAEMTAFVEAVRTGGPALMPLAGLVNVTLASFAAVESAREGRMVPIADLEARLFGQATPPNRQVLQSAAWKPTRQPQPVRLALRKTA